MKKRKNRKVVLAIVVVIFLIITFIRAQRPCVMVSPFNIFYETKTDEGAKFKSAFSKSTVQVVLRDRSGLVTVNEAGKEYQYLVKADTSRGITSVNFTDYQSTPLETHNYSYDRYSHYLKYDGEIIFYKLPKGFGLESIMQFGMLDTYSAMEIKDGLFIFWMFFFVLGFLIILLRRPLATMDSYIADIFYNLEKPIKPREWMITVLAIIGGLFIIIGVFGLSMSIL